ncbi:hypothetical protein PGQ11_014609 [Apiospora arundinis]|uniref:Myb-like domain-containing protein n=1 Tax=Apiospora arundinis TaxID=335852 RepID=A0ABR2HTG6_9PEZI
MSGNATHPDSWDEEKKLFMTVIEVNLPGFAVKDWAEIAAKRGISEAKAKQLFGNAKKRWLDATAGVVMPPPVIKTRKRNNNRRSVVSENQDIEDDGHDVPSGAPGRTKQGTEDVTQPNPIVKSHDRKKRTVAENNNEGEMNDSDDDVPLVKHAAKRQRVNRRAKAQTKSEDEDSVNETNVSEDKEPQAQADLEPSIPTQKPVKSVTTPGSTRSQKKKQSEAAAGPSESTGPSESASRKEHPTLTAPNEERVPSRSTGHTYRSLQGKRLPWHGMVRKLLPDMPLTDEQRSEWRAELAAQKVLSKGMSAKAAFQEAEAEEAEAHEAAVQEAIDEEDAAYESAHDNNRGNILRSMSVHPVRQTRSRSAEICGELEAGDDPDRQAEEIKHWNKSPTYPDFRAWFPITKGL